MPKTAMQVAIQGGDDDGDNGDALFLFCFAGAMEPNSISNSSHLSSTSPAVAPTGAPPQLPG